MMNKKILIVYGSIGLGHKVAAENIAAALQKFPGVQIVMLDLLEMYQSTKLVRGFSRFYQWSVDHAPWLWGFFYTNKGFQALTLPLRIPFAGLKVGKFKKFVEQEKPAAILTCHPNATGLAAYLKKHKQFTGSLATTFSDFHFQPYWVYPGVDKYLVMTSEQKAEVEKRGFGADQVVVTGLPVNPIFIAELDEGQIYKKFDLSRTKPIILVMGGSQGWGVRMPDLEALVSSKFDIQIVVVTGKNIVLQKELEHAFGNSKSLKILSFWSAEDIAKIFSISKILVTKPGGLTTAQALVKNLPTIFVHPLPTMEEMNLDYLLAHGAGVYAKTSQELVAWVERLLTDKKYYQGIRQRQKLIAVPNAAEIAAKSIIDMLNV